MQQTQLLNEAIDSLPVKTKSDILQILSAWQISPDFYTQDSITQTAKLLDEIIPGTGMDLVSLGISGLSDHHPLAVQNIKQAIEQAGLADG